MAIIAIYQEKILTIGDPHQLKFPEIEDFRDGGFVLGGLGPLVPGGLGDSSGHRGLWLADYPEPVTEQALTAGGFSLRSLRELYHLLPTADMALACYFYHFLHWLDRSRFCGHCSAPLPLPGKDAGRQCQECHHRYYAQISPAVIVGVVKDDKLLLAQHARHLKSGLRSLLAGFVEPQESLEQCVAREIHEEVGIEISDLRYFGSQPWPFPSSLMIGYFAKHKSGVLVPDGIEVMAADWYARGHLPISPGSFSIAGKMIEWFDNGGDPDTLGIEPLKVSHW